MYEIKELSVWIVLFAFEEKIGNRGMLNALVFLK